MQPLERQFHNYEHQTVNNQFHMKIIQICQFITIIEIMFHQDETWCLILWHSIFINVISSVKSVAKSVYLNLISSSVDAYRWIGWCFPFQLTRTSFAERYSVVPIARFGFSVPVTMRYPRIRYLRYSVTKNNIYFQEKKVNTVDFIKVSNFFERQSFSSSISLNRLFNFRISSSANFNCSFRSVSRSLAASNSLWRLCSSKLGSRLSVSKFRVFL